MTFQLFDLRTPGGGGGGWWWWLGLWVDGVGWGGWCGWCVCVPNRISKPHTTEHATTLRARASGSNGPLPYNTNCREAAPRRVLPCRPPGGPAPPLISIIIDPGARSRIGLETYVLRGIRMVPRWFRDGSGAATVGRPYVLRGIRMVPRWFHDGSARVPRWFHDGSGADPV